MSVDVVSQPVDRVERADLEFHPLVLAELQTELGKWTSALEQVPPEKLQAVQGKVAILRWVLSRMIPEILDRERARASERNNTD